MSEDYADRTLKALITWGRYGEIFAYDETSETSVWRTRSERHTLILVMRQSSISELEEPKCPLAGTRL